ncbi:MAG: hypothetical protein GWO22_37520, partial [Actinobacteria bacterium]|nr:hypothetical protein [Actinomycetota bacterium]
MGHHAGHGAGSMSGMLHWLRDAVLAIPVAALVVVAANGLIGRRPQLSRFLGRLRWGLLVGIGYAAVLIPGGLAHGFLFPAERSEQALIHAVADAVALLPASLYTALGVAFLLGIPGEARSPMAVALRAVRRWVAAHRARGAVAGTAFLTVMPAFVIIGSLAAAPTPAADAAEWEFIAECADTRTITADVV